MSAKQQVKLIADYIMANVPGEPSRSEGAGDCAVRLLDKYRTALGRIVHETDAHEIARQALGEENQTADTYKITLDAILEPILTPDGEHLPVGKVLAEALGFIEMTQALADEHWEVERDKSRRQR